MIIAIVMLEDIEGGMTIRQKHVEMVREVFPDAEIYHTQTAIHSSNGASKRIF